MSETLLRVRDVSKAYYERGKLIKQALQGVSLEIKKGEVFGLLGVNGAGKTTLATILASLHPLDAGEVLWKGESIYKSLLDYRAIIGYCPQHPNVEKNLTLDELLLFAGRCFGLSKVKTIARKNHLLKKFDLTTYAKRTVGQLSGGYRQRFLIARALMHEPELVILDEPTVGLDPHIRRQLWEVIRELKSNHISVILTTHYLDEAEALSDRVCLLHNGVIRVVDTPDNLKTFHKKNNLEEVFLKFVDDPEAEIFNSVTTSHD